MRLLLSFVGFIFLLSICGITIFPDASPTPTPSPSPTDLCANVNCSTYCQAAVEYSGGSCTAATGQCAYSSQRVCTSGCNPAGTACLLATPTPSATATPTPTPSPTATPTPTPSATATLAGCSGKVPLTNGGFEAATYYGWISVGNAFGDAPSNLDAENVVIMRENPVNAYYDYEGHYAASSFIPAGHQAGATGTLTSDTFLLRCPYLEFLVIAEDNQQLYVNLYVEGQSSPILHKQFNYPTARFQRIAWDVSQWQGQTLYIKVVDETPSGTRASAVGGSITVDDFYQINEPTVATS